MTITDRYATAVRASTLKPARESMPEGTDPARTAAPVDVIGAFGLMSRMRPLAAALVRLLEGGDNSAERHVVNELAAVVEGRAYRTGVEITRPQAVAMSQAVLAWYRHGTCSHCGGHGFERVEGAPMLSGSACKPCKGTGRIPFASQFALERQELAAWTLGKVEREIALAGPAAMAKLAPRLDL